MNKNKVMFRGRENKVKIMLREGKQGYRVMEEEI